jgi:hypothetical protein
VVPTTRNGYQVPLMATHQRLEEERVKWRTAGRDAAAAQDVDAQDPVARAAQLRARGDSEGACTLREIVVYWYSFSNL